MLQWVLTIRNFDICHFSFMSLLNCYPYFHIRHKNDVYRGINDGCRIFPKCATFKRDGYQRLTVLVSSERRRLVGMWITSNYFFFSFAISHNVELIQPPRINFTNVLRAAFSRTNSKIEKRHWWLDCLLRFWDHLVSILSMFYAHVFCTNFVSAAFSTYMEP